MLDKVFKIAGATSAVVGVGFGLTKMYLNISKEKAVTDAVRREAERSLKIGEQKLAQERAAHLKREKELLAREEEANAAHEARLKELAIERERREQEDLQIHQARLNELEEARLAAEKKAALRVAELEEELLRKKATPKTTKPRKPRTLRIDPNHTSEE